MADFNGLWMSPLDPYGEIGTGVPTGVDFWDLVNAGKTSEWQSVLSNVSVFILNAYLAAVEPEANLRSLFSFLEANNIKLALGTGVLHNDGVPGPGYLVEGYNGALDPIVNRVKLYGGNLQVLVMDEPFYFGTQWVGPYAAQASISDIAQMTADGVATVKKYFPNVLVADTEPMVPTNDLPEWLQAYKDAVGAPLDYFIADNDWYGNYEDHTREIKPLLAADGTKYGVIYNGGADNNDAVWTQRAAANYRSVESDPSLQPDFAAFDTWTPNPTRYLSEDTNGTLTNLMLDYLKFKGIVASDPVITIRSDRTSTVSAGVDLKGTGEAGQALYLYDERPASGSDDLGPTLGAFGSNAPLPWQQAGSNTTFLSGSEADVVRLSGYNSATSRDITGLTIGQTYRVAVEARASAVANSAATHSALIIAVQDAAMGRIVIGDLDVEFGQEFNAEISVVFTATSESMSLQFLNFREEPSLLDLRSPELLMISSVGATQVDNAGEWAAHLNLTNETKHTLIAATDGDPLTLDDSEGGITTVDLTPSAVSLPASANGSASVAQETSISTLFDTNFYLTQNPDVARAGVDPLTHYEQYGWREGRDPSLLFSTNKYIAAYSDVARAGVDPLLDYAEYGQAEGRMAFMTGGAAPADPLVDAAYYDRQLGATIIPTGPAAQQQAASSYNTAGWRQGLNPDAWFDTNYYLAHNPDVARAGINPLTHYEQYGWREGRDPSALFSTNAYLAAYPDVARAGMDPLLHYVEYGQSEGRMAFLTGGALSTDPLVDAAYYAPQLGATAISAGPAAQQQAASSYNTAGWRQGLNPDAWFDTNYYLAHNPDVARAGINPLTHYEQYGWREGRDPSALFSTSKYLGAYADVARAGMDPLLHYVEHGQAEGRTAFAASA